jgi:hypothetical protein
VRSFHQEVFVDSPQIIADEDEEELSQDTHHQLERSVLTSTVEVGRCDGPTVVISNNEACSQLSNFPSLHVCTYFLPIPIQSIDVFM